MAFKNQPTSNEDSFALNGIVLHLSVLQCQSPEQVLVRNTCLNRVLAFSKLIHNVINQIVLFLEI